MRSADEDLTTRARIRDVALVRFGRDGFAATGVRAIAADAGVSAGLVLHHFGSKDGLRAECDAHVAELIRGFNTGVDGDLMASVDGWTTKVRAFSWLRDYLARALTDGTDMAAQLLADLVRDAESYLLQWEEAGILRPARDGADRADRAAYLTATSLGMLVLEPLLARHLGLADGADVEIQLSRQAMDLYTHGLFADAGVGEALAARLEEDG